MEAPPPSLIIRTLLVNLRNELVLEGEMERASRPTAPSAAFGKLPASNPTGLAESSLADLMALGEMPSVPDEDLIDLAPVRWTRVHADLSSACSWTLSGAVHLDDGWFARRLQRQRRRRA